MRRNNSPPLPNDTGRKLKLSVSKLGLNANVFDAKLPVRRKYPICQRAEDELVNQLVEKKGAFSAGDQWFAFGFQLLGSSAQSSD